MKEISRPEKADKLLRIMMHTAVYMVVFAVGLFYLKAGLQLMEDQQLNAANTQSHLEELSSGNEEISFEEFCRRNPVSTCWDNHAAGDFLYNETETVAVLPQEEVNPEIVEETLEPQKNKARKIAALIEEELINKLPVVPSQLQINTETMSQELLDKIYEEPLPDNIIDEPNNPYVHLNNKKIQHIKFLPEEKPPYFGKEPVIAIVIDDMGVSQRRTKDIISLDAPLTASFLTYSQHLEEQVEAAQAAGHEIMIHVPMEAQKSIDEAPDVLTTRMTSKEIQKNLEIMLNKFEGIRGINNHMGSKLTEDAERMTAVMEVLKEKHLFFLDSKTTAKSQGEKTAENLKVAHAHRHVFLDNNNDKTYILGQLEQTEKLARKNGFAIAIGHPKSQTYEALKEWLGTLPEKSIRLVHLSKIMTVLNPHSNIEALGQKKVM